MADLGLPQDRNGKAVQTLSPDDTTVAQVAFGAASANVALPTGAEIVEISSSDFCRVAFGGSAVAATATSRISPPGRAVYRVPPGATKLAAIQLGSTSGFVTITRLF
jgi:hypothetical protein